MPYSLRIVTDATWEPVSVADARANSRIDISDDDALLLRMIRAARERAEAYTGRTIPQKTLRLAMDSFPVKGWWLPGAPVQSVTSVLYKDTNGNDATLSTSLYDVDTYSEPGRIVRAWQAIWPNYRLVANSVRITYVAGYTAATAVPEGIKSAILLMAGTLYQNREDVGDVQRYKMPRAAEDLLEPYRIGDEFHCYAVPEGDYL